MAKNNIQRNQKALQGSGASSSLAANEEGFARAWAKLCAAHPRIEVSQATTEVYFEKLCKYNADVIMAAIDLAIERCKFFPTVAELLENIQVAAPRRKLIEGPRPGREEAGEILTALRALIAEQEGNSLLRDEKRLEERRAELREQARQLGVKK